MGMTLFRLLLAFVAGGVLVAVSLEGAALLIAPEQLRDTCARPGNMLAGFRPNCSSQPMKLSEGTWMSDVTNECGYRTRESCRRRVPGGLRVAMLGSSISRGHFVAYDESLAARVGVALSRACERPVDVQNLAIPRTMDRGKPIWIHMADKTPEAVALNPQAIITVLSPVDLGAYKTPPAASEYTGTVSTAPVPWTKHHGVLAQLALLKQRISTESRALLLARLVLYRDPTREAATFTGRGDESDFIRAPFSPLWQMRLEVADRTLGRIAAAANGAHVPWFVFLMPLYGQTVLAHDPSLGHGDPYLLGRALGAHVGVMGGHFHDLTLDTARVARPGAIYFIGDGHLNGDGHAVLAHGIEDTLLGTAPFASCQVRPR